MSAELLNLNIKEAREKLASEEISAVGLTEAYLANIEKKNSDLNAYLEVFTDSLEQAKELDQTAQSRKDLPLFGIPLAVKDNILLRGRKASSASLMLESYTATYDATVIKKLTSAGAIFLGRTNMDEFAMGGSTENSAFGPTKNPVDPTRVPGGSSGGSASAVGGALALGALGSDTGGSIRQPASFCGVVGLKPTYGTVSRFGLMAMASSLDQIGPLTKTVADAKIIYDVIAGPDKNDSTSIGSDVRLKSKEKYVVGIPKSFLAEGLDSEVSRVFDETIAKLKAEGHEIREIEMPNIKYSLACYYVIMPAEVSSNLARFDGVKYGLYVDGGENLLEDYLSTRASGFGAEARRRIILGTYVLSAGYYDAYYGQATGVRKLIKADYQNVFGLGVDVVLTPTAPSPAFRLGEKTSDPLQMYLEDIFTVPANLAGIPALSVPAGLTKDGLPIGVQLAGNYFSEDVLFDLGQVIEKFNF